MSKITVIKQTVSGTEVWRYSGQLLVRDSGKVVLSAHFTKEDFLFNGMMLKKGDLFYEAYFRKKWYNIFEIYDRDSTRLKGWYCNVTAPARIRRWDVSYRDLALDLLVFPDGRQIVLDEDEFEAEEIPATDRQQALAALEELKAIFSIPADFGLRRDTVVKRYLV